MRSLRFARLVGLFLAFVPLAARAQVSVAPVGLFLGDENRFGTFYVANQSAVPQEVVLAFRFGYPTTDSTGHMFMQYEDSTAAARHSIAPYLRSFPLRFVLPPSERQVVRIIARPPSDLGEGLHWTRLVTTATPQATALDTSAGAIRAQVIFRLQQVTSVFYAKGDPTVTVGIERLEARADSGAVVLTAEIRRGGNAPFLGTAVLRLYDMEGSLVKKKRARLAVYFDMRRRFRIALPTGAAGPFTAEVTLTTERSDVPPAHRLSMQPVTKTVSFRVE